MESKANEIMEATEKVTNEAVREVAPASVYCSLLITTVVVGMGVAFGKDAYDWAKAKIKSVKLPKKQKIERIEVDPDETDFTEE